MEVPGLGVESVLQLPVYSHSNVESKHFCDLHCSSQQHQISDPLSESRDQTCILTSRIRFWCATTGISLHYF